MNIKGMLTGHSRPPLPARHSRSKSAPEEVDLLPNLGFQLPKQPSSQSHETCAERTHHHRLRDHRASLEHSVLELQRQLDNERAVRHALEAAAVGHCTAPTSPAHRRIMPQTDELLNEINVLEEEVGDLEHQLLALYRQFFTRFISRSSSSSIHDAWEGKEGQCHESRNKWHGLSQLDQSNVKKPSNNERKLGQGYRSDVLEARAVEDTSIVILEKLGCQSKVSESISTDELCGSRSAMHSKTVISKNKSLLNEREPQLSRDHLYETPNKLSEELIRCMVTIFCMLSEPPLSLRGVPVSSPCSSRTSSTSLSSILGILSDGWSPGHNNKGDYSYEAPLVDPFQVKGKSGVLGTYRHMVEVPWISVDKERISYAARMLRGFRSMVEQLEKVDPSRLKHDEKLAFWINVYNALLMHAYLAYGIPQNSVKRTTLLQRAAYKIGGRSVNAYAIEQSILGCRSHSPAKSLFSSGPKFKSGDGRRSYAIEKEEPLVCFALCCGGRSDPAVRVYTAKEVHKELDAAKREFLAASIGFRSEKKVLLPKIVEWYVREASIASSSLLDWLSQCADDKREADMLLHLARSNKSSNHNNKHCIEWQPYNFSFRYLFHPELASRYTSCTHCLR